VGAQMKDYLDVVRAGYDDAAERYAAERDRFMNEGQLRQFMEYLRPSSTILDVGCGSGVPIASFLTSQGHQVIGIDLSPRQIELARASVPGARFEVRNMLDFGPSEFTVDGIVSFYAIFHTPRERHAALLRTLGTFVGQGSPMLITMGAGKYEAVEDDFHGVEMYWSQYDPVVNRRLVTEAGFRVVTDVIDEAADERHQIILGIRT
jgi:SAM-dependent methyltransferase